MFVASGKPSNSESCSLNFRMVIFPFFGTCTTWPFDCNFSRDGKLCHAVDTFTRIGIVSASGNIDLCAWKNGSFLNAFSLTG